MGKSKKGLLITFEGVEGSGKSTQIKEAARFFKKQSKKVLILREPGATKVGEAIREVLLNPKLKEMTPETELLLFFAARKQIVLEKIVPALKEGSVVICDRFVDSTLAYQGYGRKLDLATVKKLGKYASHGIEPDLTLLLDLPVEAGLRRGGCHDRMEKSGMAFHRRVRKGFLEIAKGKKRIRVIDARKSLKEVTAKVLRELENAS